MCHACWFEEWSMLQFWQHFYLASFGSSHRSTIKWSGPGPNLENLQNVSWPVITHSVPLFVKVSWCAWYNTFGTFLHMSKQCQWCHGGPHNVRRYPKKRPAAARKRIGGDTSHTLILACGLSASHVGYKYIHHLHGLLSFHDDDDQGPTEDGRSTCVWSDLLLVFHYL